MSIIIVFAGWGDTHGIIEKQSVHCLLIPPLRPELLLPHLLDPYHPHPQKY